MNGVAIVNLARYMAEVAHDGQCRRNTGEPYFNHLCAVADSCQGWERKTVAYLHDSVEDGKLTTNVLFKFFPVNVVSAVLSLTRNRDEETYAQYIERLISDGNPLVLPVKLADLRHNLSDVHNVGDDGAGLERRYRKAEGMILDALENRT